MRRPSCEPNKRYREIAVDPVTLDILKTRTHVREEMMKHSSHRHVAGYREQGDAFPLITDRVGRMIVGQMGSFLQGFSPSDRSE